MKEESDQKQIEKRVQELLSFSQSDKDVERIEAAQVFSQVCFRDDLPRKDEVLSAMVRMIGDSSKEVKLHLVQGFRFLAGSGWGEAWGTEEGRKDPSSKLTPENRKILEFTADNLLKLTRDSNPQVQREALDNLGITGFVGVRRKEIEGRCQEILEEKANRDLYNMAIDQLAIMRSEDPRVRENLLERLSDDNEHQRIRALQGLRQVGEPQDLERVGEMKQKNPGPIEDFNIRLTTETLEGRSQERSHIEKE
jgi:HEAT repeat protein